MLLLNINPTTGLNENLRLRTTVIQMCSQPLTYTKTPYLMLTDTLHKPYLRGNSSCLFSIFAAGNFYTGKTDLNSLIFGYRELSQERKRIVTWNEFEY